MIIWYQIKDWTWHCHIQWLRGQSDCQASLLISLIMTNCYSKKTFRESTTGESTIGESTTWVQHGWSRKLTYPGQVTLETSVRPCNPDMVFKDLLTTLSCMQGAWPNDCHVSIGRHSHHCHPRLRPVRSSICLSPRTSSCWRQPWWCRMQRMRPLTNSAYTLDMD